MTALLAATVTGLAMTICGPVYALRFKDGGPGGFIVCAIGIVAALVGFGAVIGRYL